MNSETAHLAAPESARGLALTEEQRQAVERLGQDVCVVAGPGSGKTRVLVERFRRRVEAGVSPLRILAVTFTEKAANELKQRLARDFRGAPRLRRELERAPVYTIDGLCAHLLREHAVEAGIDPRFEVLDAADAYAELYSTAEEALDGLLADNREGMRTLLTALDLADPVSGLIDAYQSMRLSLRPEGGERGAELWTIMAEFYDCLRILVRASAHGWSHGQAEALGGVKAWALRMLAMAGTPASHEHFRTLAEFDCNLNSLRKHNQVYDLLKNVKQRLLPAAQQALVAEFYSASRALLWEALERLDRGYGERKRVLNALDFADLEEFAIRLLRDSEPLRERLQSRFDEILMDELQDTNPLQATLVGLLRRPNRFFAVGDVNQSIYGFRHANPDVFRDYRENLAHAGNKVDRLRQNHRSRAPILWATEAVLGGAEGIEPHRLEAARRFAPKAEPSVEVIAAEMETAEDAAQIEALSVARRIAELAGRLLLHDRETGGTRPARLSDIAILVRNINALPPIEHALHRAGIPYLVARGKRFFEAQEVVDLVHLLRVIVNPRDEISTAAVLRSPLVGVGDETLLRLKQAGNLGEAVAELAFPAGISEADAARLRSFRALLERLRAHADAVSPDRLLIRALDAVDYENRLDPRYRGNLRKLLGRLREWFTAEPRPLSRLVEELEFLRASDPDESTAPPDDSANAVQVLTVHGAKGLEFPVVFLAALHKGVARETPPLSFSPGAGLVVRWLDPVTGRPVMDLPYSLYAEEQKRKTRAEENRLLYVAMTRAEEHLVLSFAQAGRGARNWAGMVTAGLGLDLAAAGSEPFIQSVTAGSERSFDVRIAVARAAPGAATLLGAPEAARPVERLPKPAVTGQYDTTASVTSIVLFQSCPRRYFLSRYIGWERDRSSEPPEELAVEDGPLEAGELGRRVHDLLAERPVCGASSIAQELAARFQTSDIGRRASTADRIERESEFLMAIEDVIVQGRIDLWFEDGGQLILADYKTDDTDAAGAERYALQLQLYSLALERLAGRLPDHALIYLLRPNIAVPVDLGPESLSRARAAVREFREAQSQLHFPLVEGEQCRRCPYYRGLCPAGKEKGTA